MSYYDPAWIRCPECGERIRDIDPGEPCPVEDCDWVKPEPPEPDPELWLTRG